MRGGTSALSSYINIGPTTPIPYQSVKAIAFSGDIGPPDGCGTTQAPVPFRVRVINTGTLPVDTVLLGHRARRVLPPRQGQSPYADGPTTYLEPPVVETLVLAPPLAVGDSIWLDSRTGAAFPLTALFNRLSYWAYTPSRGGIDQYDTLKAQAPGAGPSLSVAIRPAQPNFSAKLGYGVRADRPFASRRGRWTYFEAFKGFYFSTARDSLPYFELPCINTSGFAGSGDSLIAEGKLRGTFDQPNSFTYQAYLSVNGGQEYALQGTYTASCEPDSGLLYYRLDISSLMGESEGRLAFRQVFAPGGTNVPLTFCAPRFRRGGRRVVATAPILSSPSLTLIPNPSTSRSSALLRLSGSGSLESLKVLDASGRLIHEAAATGPEALLPQGLAPGLYLVRTRLAGGGQRQTRWVVE